MQRRGVLEILCVCIWVRRTRMVEQVGHRHVDAT
jgi:hypothetical protein